MERSYRKVKIACYLGSASMAVVSNLPPVLFLTFREEFGFSFTRLGLLILFNFMTQLGVDLLLSFCPRIATPRFLLTAMPLLSLLGFGLYGLIPALFPEIAFWGLVAGTVIFSASSGLGEVLISPVVAAIPSPDPEKQMSRLHSAYAWATIPVVILSATYLVLLDGKGWHNLLLFFSLIPLCSFFLFLTASFPPMEEKVQTEKREPLWQNPTFRLCVIAIFFGGAAECTVSQWASGYLEAALGIPKMWGDVLGVALFALMMGIGRSLYGKLGGRIDRILILSAAGTLFCYALAVLTPFSVLGLFAVALSGLTSAMLWPGTLVLTADLFPRGGVFLYAVMASGGDLGAALGPQLVGMVTDAALLWPPLGVLSDFLSLSPESFGMRLGLLVGMLFPAGALALFSILKRRKKSV